MQPTLPTGTPEEPQAPVVQPATAAGGPRAGQLTPGWRIVFGLAWAGIFVGLSAVWKASRDVGLSVWWIGPAGEPQPVWVTILPFIAPGAMVLGALYGSRWLPWAGLLAAAVTAAIGAGDIGRVNGLAVVELSLAAAGAAVSVAAMSGRYRPPHETHH